MLYRWILDKVTNNACGKVKTYRPHYNGKCIHHIHDKYAFDSQVMYQVLFNQSRETSTFEIVGTWWNMDNKKNDYVCTKKPIPFDVFYKLFGVVDNESKDGKKKKMTWDFHHLLLNVWVDNTTFENVDNKMMFKVSTTWLRDRLGGLSADVIYFYLPFQLVNQWGLEIGIASTFPSLGSWEDVCEARDGLATMNHTYHLMANKAYESTLDKLRLDMETVKKGLLDSQNRLDAICIDAANAMNLLEEKYGIQIEG